MKLRRPTLVICLALAPMLGAACRRRPPPAPTPPPGTTAPPGTPTVGPMGTTPTTPSSPTNAQVQISGTTGTSSVRSVPPTPATGCPATQPNTALGPGTVHNIEVNTNETWTLEGSPHRLPDGLRVTNGASLTITPCAVLLVAHDDSISVEDGAAITAVGDAAHPIRIGSDSPTPQPGDWRGVYLAEGTRATSRLAFVTIEHGGGGGDNLSGSLHVAMRALDLANVTVQNGRGYGVVLDGHGGFAPGAANLRVTGTVVGGAENSGSMAVGDVDSIRTIPSGTYTGNEVNEIYVNDSSNSTARTTGTWPNPGVRYRFADGMDVRIEGSSGPIITIAPGATLAFGHDASLAVGWTEQGGLIADGRADATRITFTQSGNDPGPGQWEGLYLGSRFNRSQTRLNYVTISYAGGNGGSNTCAWAGDNTSNHALLFIQAPPTAQTVTHTQFIGAPADGVAIARNFPMPTPPVSFVDRALGNDFAQLGTRCRQSQAQDSGGNCPDPAPCE